MSLRGADERRRRGNLVKQGNANTALASQDCRVAGYRPLLAMTVKLKKIASSFAALIPRNDNLSVDCGLLTMDLQAPHNGTIPIAMAPMLGKSALFCVFS
jgi:hypothetical protein